MTLKEYIQGNRRGKEANRLERQAMNDPFLQEAIGGYDAVAGNHAETIERLEDKILSKSSVQRHSRALVFFAMAASIFLLIGFGTFFLLQKGENKMPNIAQTLPKVNTPVALKDTTVILAQQLKKTSTHEKIIAEVTPNNQPTLALVPINEVAQAETVKEVSYDKSMNVSEAQPVMTKSISPRSTSVLQGKVVDETGQPIIGATVMEKGTTHGTVTDIEGKFNLHVNKPDSAKLIASFIGYDKKEVNAVGSNAVIAMEPSSRTLNEVVVVGYGVQKRTDMTGAVARVENKSFGEKEFIQLCQIKAEKNICDDSIASVQVSCFVTKEGRPSELKFNSFTCEDAKAEIEHLLLSSPNWTKTNRKVVLEISW